MIAKSIVIHSTCTKTNKCFRPNSVLTFTITVFTVYTASDVYVCCIFTNALPGMERKMTDEKVISIRIQVLTINCNKDIFGSRTSNTIFSSTSEESFILSTNDKWKGNISAIRNVFPGYPWTWRPNRSWTVQGQDASLIHTLVRRYESDFWWNCNVNGNRTGKSIIILLQHKGNKKPVTSCAEPCPSTTCNIISSNIY